MEASKKAKRKKSKELNLALEVELSRAVFMAMARHSNGLTSDDIWKICRDEMPELPPTYIARNIGPIIRSFRARHYLTKTKEFRQSNRPPGYSPLPIYLPAHFWNSEKQLPTQCGEVSTNGSDF